MSEPVKKPYKVFLSNSELKELKKQIGKNNISEIEERQLEEGHQIIEVDRDFEYIRDIE